MIESLLNKGIYFAPADKAGGSGEIDKGPHQYLEFEGPTPTRAVIKQGEARIRTVNLQVARSLDNAVPLTFGAKIRKALHSLLGV